MPPIGIALLRMLTSYIKSRARPFGDEAVALASSNICTGAKPPTGHRRCGLAVPPNSGRLPVPGIDAHLRMNEEMATTTLAAQQTMRLVPVVKPRLAVPEKHRAGIDPEWMQLWSICGGSMIRADEVSIHEYRRDPQKYSFTYPMYRGPDVFLVQDLLIPVSKPRGHIAIKVYTPQGEGPFPVHINFHGGGWVLGGLHTEAAWCRHVCNKVGIKVVDVDYRLAPEFTFPTSIFDCWDTLIWTIANAKPLNIDPAKVSIGGLGAGAHMAAVLAHFARETRIDLRFQLLVVPITDMRYAFQKAKLDLADCPYQSARSYRDLPWRPLQRIQWSLRYWLGKNPDEQEVILKNWICTPVLAPNFENLAPAHIVTAEFDIQRDEAEFYGRLLEKGGNNVTMKRYAGMPHEFAHYNSPAKGLSKSLEFIEDTCRILRAVHFRE